MRAKINIKAFFRKIPGDLITPVQLFLTLRNLHVGTVLLESTDYHRKDNHYSFIAFEPLGSVTLESDQLSLKYGDDVEHIAIRKHSPCFTQYIQQFLDKFHVLTELPELLIPPFIGYIQYDAIEYYESLTLRSDYQIPFYPPLIQFKLYRYYYVFDHYHNDLYFVALVDEEENIPDIDGRLNRIIARTSSIFHQHIPFRLVGQEEQSLTERKFQELVSKAKYHVYRGDVFQIVLSNRYSQAFEGDDFQVYRILRRINPSPYLFYFDMGNFHLFGSSPESQIRIQNREITIHPIAGTYRRSGNLLEDQKLAQDLLSDEKEAAEHVMLVDLARNDLSKHGEGVRVATFKEIQYYSHVIHLVSEVKAQLRQDAMPLEVIMDTFPAGTLTGAPKYRAMQLIDSFENLRRQFYGGAVGFLKMNGDANLAIFIRSALSYENTLYFQAGAGIVADSDPEKEALELRNKSNAIRHAIVGAASESKEFRQQI